MRPFWLALLLVTALAAQAAENLKLNGKLDYQTDSQDGPLITGDRMLEGLVSGKPNYVIIYGEACFNSKRQARRTVSLYQKYRGRVNFVVIDLDQQLSPQQAQLRERYYQGSIPHVVIIDRQGKAVYNRDGEVAEEDVAALLDQTLK